MATNNVTTDASRPLEAIIERVHGKTFVEVGNALESIARDIAHVSA